MRNIKLKFALFLLFWVMGSLLTCNAVIRIVKNGNIVLQVTPNALDKVSFSITAKELSIDWGEGEIEKVKPKGNTSISHTYSSSEIRVIEIKAKELQTFNTGEGDYSEIIFNNCDKLIELDLTESLNLEELTIKKAKNLKALNCSGLKLKSLNINSCENLRNLDCSRNKLIELKVDGAKKLTSLDCSYNTLVSLNLSKNKELEIAKCNNNSLKTLNVDKTISLETLKCENNSIKKLKLNESSKLSVLNCDNNELKSLDLLENKDLSYMSCLKNKFKASSVKLNANQKFDYLKPSHDDKIFDWVEEL